jgi:hypothetical protein
MRTTLVSLAVAMALATAGSVQAQPQVTGMAGSFQRGGSVTISGVGFGTKVPAAPLKYDGFENGTLGSQVDGWHTETTIPGRGPVYSDAVARVSGSRVVYQNHLDGNYNCTLGLTGLSVGKLYLSGWYFRRVSGDSTRNFKFISFRGGPPGARDAPEGRTDMYASNTRASSVAPTGHMYTANCAENMVDNDYGLGGSLASPDFEPNGAWHRVESYMDIGDVGQPNGSWQIWNDLDPWVSTNGVFRESSCVYTNLYLAAYWASDAYDPEDGIPGSQWYWDELYIDTTRARVEAGNASTWNACTHREIQIPSAWSGNSVTVAVNQGVFAAGQTVYLYVVDQSGAVNSSGYPVTVGGTANQAPLVGITAPTSGSSWTTSSTTVAMAGTASDDGALSTVTWNNDRGGSGTAVNVSGNWTSWSIPNVALVSGQNTITVSARDTGGLTGSDVLVITYDGGPPGQPGQPQR